MPCVYS
ncbi:exosome complex component RRP4 [Kluyveromyces marxianus]|nr:exosome complex component RRP4 [Kluyveromyces marxianus]